MSRKRNPQAGMAALISLLITCVVLVTLAAMAAPNLIAAAAAGKAQDLKAYMRNAAMANALLGQCAATAAMNGGVNPCASIPSIQAAIPSNADFEMEGYEVISTTQPFTMTVNSVDTPFSGPMNFYIDTTLQIKCSPTVNGPATAVSPTCN